MSEFARVLFVTPHAFNRVDGGGITFSNLFCGWPKSSLATVHNDPEPTVDEVCEHYYVLGADELDLSPPFDRLRRRYRAVTVDAGTGVAETVPGVGTASRLKGVAMSLFGDSFPERARLTPSLERWIDAYSPQLLYTILGSNGMMSLVDQVRRRFDLPVVVHIMDDWVASYHRRGLLAPWQRWRMQRWVHFFFGLAERRLAISTAMCDAYTRRYGGEFQSFQNTIDVGRWSTYAKRDSTAGSPADLLYVGSVFPGAQLESLIDCCRAVAELNSEGTLATLTIAAPHAQAARYRDRLALDPAIRIEATIRDDKTFFQRIAAADVLLLPVNFSNDSVRFIRYSMPTKVPAYLTVGTPILAYGPAVTAQIAYAIEGGWAEVIERRDPNSLVAGMHRVINDIGLRTRLARNARACAERNHDAVRVRSAFQALLNSAATAPRRGRVER